jgi:hypothetical protein
MFKIKGSSEPRDQIDALAKHPYFRLFMCSSNTFGYGAHINEKRMERRKYSLFRFTSPIYIGRQFDLNHITQYFTI